MFGLNCNHMKKCNTPCCIKEIKERHFEEHCFRTTKKGQKNLENSLNFSDADHVSVHSHQLQTHNLCKY